MLDAGHVELSVVIPVHNAAEFIRPCLDSVLSQRVNLEIICVDDCSSDDSYQICRDYSRRHRNITVLRNEKPLFAGGSRNRGIEMAKGEYIAFLDADDKFAPGDALLRAYGQARRDNLDVLLAASSKIGEDGRILKTDIFLHRELFPRETVFAPDALGAALFLCTLQCPWGKLYRRAFVAEHALSFLGLKRSEDFPMVGLSLASASRIGVFSQAVCEHRIGVRSSLESTKDETPLVFFEAERLFRDSLKERNLWSRFKAAVYTAFVVRLAYNLRALRSHPGYKAIIAKYRDEREQWICWDEVVLPKRFAAEGQLVKDVMEDRDADAGIALSWSARKFLGGIRCLQENGLKYTARHAVGKVLRLFGARGT